MVVVVFPGRVVNNLLELAFSQEGVFASEIDTTNYVVLNMLDKHLGEKEEIVEKNQTRTMIRPRSGEPSFGTIYWLSVLQIIRASAFANSF